MTYCDTSILKPQCEDKNCKKCYPDNSQYSNPIIQKILEGEAEFKEAWVYSGLDYPESQDEAFEYLKQFFRTQQRELIQEILKNIEKLPVYMKVAGGDLKQPKEAILKIDILTLLQEAVEEVK